MIQTWAWVCGFEDCGHIWLMTGEEAPAKCAKCRRRGWNAGGPIKRSAAPKRIEPPATPATPAETPSAASIQPTASAGQTRNADRKGYNHDTYLSLPASQQLRYLREHPRR